MSYTYLSVSAFGTGNESLATVGYALYDTSNTLVGSRITAGVSNLNGGDYQALASLSDGFSGRIRWDTGTGSPYYFSDLINQEGTATPYLGVSFGDTNTGLLTVGYQLYNTDGTTNGSRITAGVQEWEQGFYGAVVTLPADFSGAIRWDTGAATVLYVGQGINNGGTSGTVKMRTMWRDLTGVFSTNVAADAVVDLYLSRGCEELNRRVAYHVNDDSSTVVLVNGTQEYTLPTDCVEVLWAEWNGLILNASDMRKWRSKANTADWRQRPGPPSDYAVYGRKLILRPIPNAATVASSSAITLRYVSTPPDFSTYGPDQLGSQDWILPVYFAAALWCGTRPDSDITRARRDEMSQLFETGAGLVKKQLDARRLAA